MLACRIATCYNVPWDLNHTLTPAHRCHDHSHYHASNKFASHHELVVVHTIRLLATGSCWLCGGLHAFLLTATICIQEWYLCSLAPLSTVKFTPHTIHLITMIFACILRTRDDPVRSYYDDTRRARPSAASSFTARRLRPSITTSATGGLWHRRLKSAFVASCLLSPLVQNVCLEPPASHHPPRRE